MADFEYRVIVPEYHNSEFGFDLYEGEIVTDGDFPEPDIPGVLVARGVLEYVDQDTEAARLAAAPIDDEDE